MTHTPGKPMSRPSRRLATARVVPQKWANHVDILWRYATPRKALNLAGTLLAYKTGRRRLRTFPPFLKVEVTNRCGINCTFCYAPKSGDDYPFGDYCALVDKLKPYLFEVSLHDIGEPLLHDGIAQYVTYAHERGIGTIMSSSLSVTRTDDFWVSLLQSGLDRLIVAIDGVTPAVYQRYRTAGNLDLVFHNLRSILAWRERLGSATRIEWQMIDFPWNAHEQDAARALARELGCDGFKLIHEEQLPRRDYAIQRVPRTRNCLMPYLMFIVNAQKQVRPCCNLYKGLNGWKDKDNLVGDLRTQSFEEVWNGAENARIRDRHEIHTRDFCAFCQEM